MRSFAGPAPEVAGRYPPVESWLTDEQAATLNAYADALTKGAKPSEALAVIGRGPMVAPPQVPGWMPPSEWEPLAPQVKSADSEDDAYDALELLGKRLRALRVRWSWAPRSPPVRCDCCWVLTPEPSR